MGKACAKSRDGARDSNWTSDQWLRRQMSFHVYGRQIRMENQYDDFLKVMQDNAACFHLFRFYIHFTQQPKFGSSRKALWETHTNFWLTTMQFTRISSIRIRVIVRSCCARYNLILFYEFATNRNWCARPSSSRVLKEALLCSKIFF